MLHDTPIPLKTPVPKFTVYNGTQSLRNFYLNEIFSSFYINPPDGQITQPIPFAFNVYTYLRMNSQ